MKANKTSCSKIVPIEEFKSVASCRRKKYQINLDPNSTENKAQIHKLSKSESPSENPSSCTKEQDASLLTMIEKNNDSTDDTKIGIEVMSSLNNNPVEEDKDEVQTCRISKSSSKSVSNSGTPLNASKQMIFDGGLPISQDKISRMFYGKSIKKEQSTRGRNPKLNKPKPYSKKFSISKNTLEKQSFRSSRERVNYRTSQGYIKKLKAHKSSIPSGTLNSKSLNYYTKGTSKSNAKTQLKFYINQTYKTHISANQLVIHNMAGKKDHTIDLSVPKAKKSTKIRSTQKVATKAGLCKNSARVASSFTKRLSSKASKPLVCMVKYPNVSTKFLKSKREKLNLTSKTDHFNSNSSLSQLNRTVSKASHFSSKEKPKKTAVKANKPLTSSLLKTNFLQNKFDAKKKIVNKSMENKFRKLTVLKTKKRQKIIKKAVCKKQKEDSTSNLSKFL
ncbi:unnamed protein product [Moneuplotes crassus]|uniref:Uncharacterized protein n=1 Tax=Euplotes crassus TaxID=5936 RepID=A0AAD2DCC6_EUPCR|nr:unnamed protein product [Moneuplotes crassus]